MRITFLLENAEQIWGGVKVALEDANWLCARGHEVTVVSRSGPPAWMTLECGFRQVANFGSDDLPDADALIGTFWSTLPAVAEAPPQKGVKVHLCQGYEGDNPENAALRERIEAVYRLPGLHRVTISPHLTQLLRERFRSEACELRYVVDHDVHHPGPVRRPGRPLRVGLVGPYQIPWKGLATGYAACELAHRAGQELVLVRASNVPPCADERQSPFPIEWHEQLRPDQMGDYYRSLDVFLGTSTGREEGFFLPAIEAMACGVPSVLTDIPCFRNHERLVGHDRYALFVPAGDTAAMAEALVLAGALPDVRVGLRSGGIEVAGHYRRDAHGEQFERVLQQLVDARPAAAAPPAPRPGMQLITTPLAMPQPPAAADAVLNRFADDLRDAADAQRRRGATDASARLLAAARCLTADDRDDESDDDLDDARERMATGAFARALQAFDRMQLAGRDDEAVHTGRGQCLQALGRVREATQAFRAAIAVGGGSADAFNRLGLALFQCGESFAARISFERALSLDPHHADALANLQELPAA